MPRTMVMDMAWLICLPFAACFSMLWFMQVCVKMREHCCGVSKIFILCNC